MSDLTAPRKNDWKVIVGWVLTILPAGLLLFSGVGKFFPPDAETQKIIETDLGWPIRYMPRLGIVEVIITLLFLVPQTAVLGAILITGYMGGALATHARVGDPFIIQGLLGVVVWLGIFLREPRLRAILPVRNPRRST